MCGRYSSAKTDSEIAGELGVAHVVDDEPRPSWNVAPTQQRRIVVERGDSHEHGESDAHDATRTLRSARWGLIPSWAKDIKIGHRLINARAETILSKPSFRSAATRRRALVPADGYYEWEKVGGHKVPYFLHHPNDALMTMGGLYELWPDPECPEDDPSGWLWSYTVITRPAQDSRGHIHDRAPLVVPAAHWQAWLDPTNTDKDAIAALIDAIPDPELIAREVSPAVGSVRNNSPDLIEAVGG